MASDDEPIHGIRDLQQPAGPPPTGPLPPLPPLPTATDDLPAIRNHRDAEVTKNPDELDLSDWFLAQTWIDKVDSLDCSGRLSPQYQTWNIECLLAMLQYFFSQRDKITDLPDLINMANLTVPEDYPCPSRIPIVAVDQLPGQQIRAIHFSLKFCLSRLTAMFFCRTTLDEEVYDKAHAQIKQLSKLIFEKAVAIQWIGSSLDIWWDFHSLLAQAVPALRAQVFFPINSADQGSVTSFMCSNSSTLLKDLEKLAVLLQLAACLNSPTQGNIDVSRANVKPAQTYVAESGCEMKIMQLLEVCIRVCGRSIDCEPGSPYEAVCADITDKFKNVLKFCLKVLHAQGAMNQSRTLSIHIDLFGYPMENQLGAHAPDGRPELLTKPAELNLKSVTVHDYVPDPQSELTDRMPPLKKAMKALRAAHLASFKTDSEDNTLAQDLTQRSLQLMTHLNEEKYNDPQKADVLAFFNEILSPDRHKERPTAANSFVPINDRLGIHNYYKKSLVKGLPLNFPEFDDKEVDPTIELSEQLDELKLPTPGHPNTNYPDARFLQPFDKKYDPLVDEQEEEDEDGEDSASQDEPDDFDPHGASFKPRGLLAEILLILHPVEVVPLAWILVGGLLSNTSAHGVTKGPSGKMIPATPQPERRVLETLRCNLLCFSEQGRHLLREMLIFVVAWDLADKDEYMKPFMIIISAIVNEGYMTLTYEGFKEPKDIVSPTQAAVLKVLTMLYRFKKTAGFPFTPKPDQKEDKLEGPLNRDRTLIYDLLDEFRMTVVPRTIAVIWLQGKIINDEALPEDFGLNLWDVERIYEGVYQFIELFSILAECSTWKQILVAQEFALELIELLRVLDDSIPKTAPTAAQDTATEHPTTQHEDPTDPSHLARVAVPRRPEGSAMAEAGTAYEEDEDDEDGREVINAWQFPWRNMKKLIMIVLSSLLWLTPEVKKQIRDLDGRDVILSCIDTDHYNPDIGAHAKVCVRFLMEDDEDP